MSYILRDYQEEAVIAVMNARDAGQHAALIVLPTGGGKTVVFSELIRRWNVPTLILAHRDELLTQARDKLRAGWSAADVGIVGGGRDEHGHLVTVGSVQSVKSAKRIQRLIEQGIKLAIVDEAHHAAAASYKHVLNAINAINAGTPDGAFLLGVTATPGRQDGESIASIFGIPVFMRDLPWMMEHQHLCRVSAIRVRTTTRLDQVHTRAGDFAQNELAAAINDAKRNAIIVESFLKHAATRQTIVFTASVQHAHDLAACFRTYGVSAEAVDGTTLQVERHRILSAYESREVRVVCNCGVLTEGFDAPITGCIVLARPTKSKGLYIQMLGRGLRLKLDTADRIGDCIVLDIVDAIIYHGPPVITADDILPKPTPKTTGEQPGPGGDGRNEPEILHNGEVVEQEIALLPRSAHSEWSYQDHVRVLPLPRRSRMVVIHVDDDQWLPLLESANGRQSPLLPDGTADETALTVSESLAMAWCEHKAQVSQQGKPVCWRGILREPATTKQFNMLHSLGHRPLLPDMTKGEASDWIDWYLFQKHQR